MILGEQENLAVFGLYPGDTAESFAEKLEHAIDRFGNPANTLILADLPSGTPSNASMLMVLKRGVQALSGCNLPALLEILTLRTEVGMEELLTAAQESGRAGIVSARDIIREREENP